MGVTTLCFHDITKGRTMADDAFLERRIARFQDIEATGSAPSGRARETHHLSCRGALADPLIHTKLHRRQVSVMVSRHRAAMNVVF